MADNVTLDFAANGKSISLPSKARLIDRTSTSSTVEGSKIEKSAKDFESILLGSWLQQAEQSFAKLPGGDNDEDGDSGKEQFQSMATQSLGESMTASGGIGIAKMISKQLHNADNATKPNLSASTSAKFGASETP